MADMASYPATLTVHTSPSLNKGVRKVCEKCSHGFSLYSVWERYLIRNSITCSLFWCVSKLFTPKSWPQDIWFSWLFHAHVFLWKWDDFYVEVLDSVIKGVGPCNLEPFKAFPTPHLTSPSLIFIWRNSFEKLFSLQEKWVAFQRTNKMYTFKIYIKKQK